MADALVVVGPSGVGKGTLINLLRKEFEGCFEYAISHTTRVPRVGETDGREYYFIDENQFASMIAANEFLEHAQFSGKFYGTSLKEIHRIKRENKICLLEIEVNGVMQLQRQQGLITTSFLSEIEAASEPGAESPSGTISPLSMDKLRANPHPQLLDALYIFIYPPSLDVLRERLSNRRTDMQAAIEKRLQTATRELVLMDTLHCDLKVVNADLQQSLVSLKTFVEEKFSNIRGYHQR